MPPNGPALHHTLPGAAGLISSAEGSAGRLLVDASLVLHHGLKSAVGIVRVEHYVYEYLAREIPSSMALDFVVWNHTNKAYRAVTAQERLTLASIIFLTEEAAIPGYGVHPSAIESTPAESEVVAAPDTLPEHGWPRFRMQLRLAANARPAERDAFLATIAVRHLPVLPEYSTPRRITIRAVRVCALMLARAAQKALALTARTHGAAVRLRRPDPEPVLAAVAEVDAPPPPPPPSPFRPGDTLISLSNVWDYMDYAYLASLKPEHGVRFVCCLFDVCGTEIPYVTPGPTHIYHRHWVEIGHLAERLISISQFSADSYRRFISEPNHFDVPIDVAGLPNFLHARATDIGEVAVPDLVDQDFVVFCSTIEIRKNHILLLNVWEELRQTLPEGRLPTLVFVGKWGWYTDHVRMMAERNFRLRPHVRILTEVSDAELIWMYRHASFTVFPALSEGFGLAAAESMSFGTPVVISNCPALIEATEGLMPALHPQDFLGWVREITRLVVEPDALPQLCAKAATFRGPNYHAFAELFLRAAQNMTNPETSQVPDRAMTTNPAQ